MKPGYYVGLMSGTSLDGVDAVLAEFPPDRPRVIASAHRPFDPELRRDLLALTTRGGDELDRCARLGNTLAQVYADAVAAALEASGRSRQSVLAVGCHGQTVRHRPDRGYSIQIGNAALLAELTGLTVVCDFRSRDVAAGGQGAPLVPAFHRAAFGNRSEDRAVVNLGGIANVSLLRRDGSASGFDTGPGNCLMDLWVGRHLDASYDRDGAWAKTGRVDPGLLERLLAEPYFSAKPPKSTGRELFNDSWLTARLHDTVEPCDVQATLVELTARGVANALKDFDPGSVIVCGGGARNPVLMRRLAELLSPVAVDSSARHGIDPQLVEAAAFAWLAMRALSSSATDLTGVTGARGPRVLGAIYPA